MYTHSTADSHQVDYLSVFLPHLMHMNTLLNITAHVGHCLHGLDQCHPLPLKWYCIPDRCQVDPRVCLRARLLGPISWEPRIMALLLCGRAASKCALIIQDLLLHPMHHIPVCTQWIFIYYIRRCVGIYKVHMSPRFGR